MSGDRAPEAAYVSLHSAERRRQQEPEQVQKV